MAEYNSAQDSAQHHDNLIWTTTGIIWGANFLLLGFVASALANQGHHLFIPFAGVIGLLLTGGAWRLAFIWNAVLNIKYARCRELEAHLGMHQHRDVEAKYPKGEMKVWYSLISGVFVLAWMIAFALGLCDLIRACGPVSSG